MSRCGETSGTTGECLGCMVLSSIVLAFLLIIGGIEQNPGPDVEVENTVRLMYRVQQEFKVRNSV